MLSNTRRVVKTTEPAKRRGRPASTPEARENQMISLAVDLTERQLCDGSASAQQITHYLKLGSTREKLEQEKLRQENMLTEARIEQLSRAEELEEVYKNALRAMSTYRGDDPEEGYYED